MGSFLVASTDPAANLIGGQTGGICGNFLQFQFSVASLRAAAAHNDHVGK